MTLTLDSDINGPEFPHHSCWYIPDYIGVCFCWYDIEPFCDGVKYWVDRDFGDEN